MDRVVVGQEFICPDCGGVLELANCPKCNFIIRADAKECPKCKTSLGAVACKECGVNFFNSKKYCPACNAPNPNISVCQCPHCKEKILREDIVDGVCPKCKQSLNVAICELCGRPVTNHNYTCPILKKGSGRVFYHDC